MILIEQKTGGVFVVMSYKFSIATNLHCTHFRTMLLNQRKSQILSLSTGFYGFVFFPSNLKSFTRPPLLFLCNKQNIQEEVGNFGYLALICLFIMQFSAGLGIAAVPHLLESEVFPFNNLQ